MHVAVEPVELGDDQRDAAAPAKGQRGSHSDAHQHHRWLPCVEQGLTRTRAIRRTRALCCPKRSFVGVYGNQLLTRCIAVVVLFRFAVPLHCVNGDLRLHAPACSRNSAQIFIRACDPLAHTKLHCAQNPEDFLLRPRMTCNHRKGFQDTWAVWNRGGSG